MNKQIAVYDNTVSARTYISYIAEQAGGFACIGRDGKLYIKTIGQDISELPLKYFHSFKWGEKFKVSRVKYEDGIQLFERGDTTGNTIYINQDNMFIVDQEQIDNIYEQLNGLEVYSFEGDSIIDPALDVGDLLLIDGKYVIYQGSSQYGGKFKASISSKIQNKAKEETTTRIPSQKAINRRIESRIDQVEGVIESVVSNVSEQNEKVNRVTQTVDELNSKISDIADITTSQESNSGTVSFTGINQSEPIRVEIRPLGTNISYLYPRDNLYPSDTLFMPDRIIRFRNTTTSENIDYELPTDLLYYDADNYDEFILDYDSQTCIVNKKVGYNADGTTYVLASPQTLTYTYPTIELTDGDYTVTIPGYSNAYLFVRLMAQNIYTTQFATRAEVRSEISQTTQSINLSVDSKLTNYSTTTQMNSAIALSASNVLTSVSNTYATKTELGNTETTLRGEIDVTAGQIRLEVGGKLDEADFTSANIILALNNDSSSATIKADKIDLNGKQINLTSDNIAINSTNFSVDKNGNIVASGGTIGGFNLSSTAFKGNLNGIYNYNEFDARIIRNIIMGTLYEGTILSNVLDVNNDGEVKATDYVKIKSIIAESTSNTKTVSGEVQIDSTNPKNCFNVKSGGLTAVSIGLGGIYSNCITTDDFICGYVTPSYNFYGVCINSRTAEITLTKNNEDGTTVTPTAVNSQAFNNTSLAELKKNIKEIGSMYEVVKDSTIYEFNYKNETDEDKKHIGFVIGEKYNTPDEAISQGGGSIDIYDMCSILWKTVQEMQIRIEELEGVR